MTIETKFTLHKEKGTRDYQQDEVFCFVRDRFVIFGVADGMGGEGPHGDKASAAVSKRLSEISFLSKDVVFESMRQIIHDIHKKICSDFNYSIPGTTICFGVVFFDKPEEIYVFNAGDSYCFIVDARGATKQITTIHEDQRGYITSFLGCDSRFSPTIETKFVTLLMGESLVFATDGILDIPVVVAAVDAKTIITEGMARYVKANPWNDNDNASAITYKL